MSQDLAKLSQSLGYQFRDESLLQTALTHSSFGQGHNERLEFLGDSILGWVIADALFKRFPHAREGQLSRLRAGLVKGVTLAKVARELQLGHYLRLGQGEMKSGGFRRDSILADAFEAIIGAIFLDSDIATCQQIILVLFAGRLDAQTLDDTLKDPKTRLQEFLQSRKQPLPDYRILSTSGKDHEQVFRVACEVESIAEPFEAEGTESTLR
ncbi:Ribonuclease III [gamma proteobacterium IMCC2047]|nr:Ribonuclease III [gamma proteobacterium IMCC2047]